MSITKKKYKLTEVGINTYYLELIFILLNIFQLQNLMKKKHASRNLIFEEKRQEALGKKSLNSEFIRINTSKCYDEDCEIGRIEIFKDR